MRKMMIREKIQWEEGCLDAELLRKLGSIKKIMEENDALF